ncbi:YeeE/YedE thiosulfate transporter family protein [Desulfitobacterium sp. AusDCA]
MTGGVFFGITYQSVFLKISTISSYGTKTLEDLFQVNHWLLISLFILITVVFYVGSRIMEQTKTESSASR